MYIHFYCNEKIKGGKFFVLWLFRREYGLCVLIIMIFSE
jgi:hypothetical protein